EAAQLVNLFLRIPARVCRHLGHYPITVPRNTLQRRAEHSVHVAVRLRRLKKADALVVSVAHQPRKPVLPQVALHPAAETSSSKRKPSHLHAGFTQRYPIRRALSRRLQRQSARKSKRACNKSCF